MYSYTDIYLNLIRHNRFNLNPKEKKYIQVVIRRGNMERRLHRYQYLNLSLSVCTIKSLQACSYSYLYFRALSGSSSSRQERNRLWIRWRHSVCFPAPHHGNTILPRLGEEGGEWGADNDHGNRPRG